MEMPFASTLVTEVSIGNQTLLEDILNNYLLSQCSLLCAPDVNILISLFFLYRVVCFFYKYKLNFYFVAHVYLCVCMDIYRYR